MNIKEWQEIIHAWAFKKGWWEDATLADGAGGLPLDIRLRAHRAVVAEKLLLIVSEVSEATEEMRNGNPFTAFVQIGNGKPEGFAIELADAAIRILDLCAACGIDLNEMIRIKHNYNVNRPHRHGGKNL